MTKYQKAFMRQFYNRMHLIDPYNQNGRYEKPVMEAIFYLWMSNDEMLDTICICLCIIKIWQTKY